MLMIMALGFKKRQWLATETKMIFPRGGKTEQVQTKDTKSKVVVVRDADMNHIENSARRKKMRKGGERKGWNRKNAVIMALAVMKRQWFAMETKMKIPRGGKENMRR